MARSKMYYFARGIFRKVYRFTTLRVVYPALYRINSKSKVDEKKVLFIEVRMPEISDSFELLYKKLKNEGKYDIHEHYLHMSFVNKIKYDRYCRAMIKDVATAKYVFLNESSDVFAALPLRKETIVTQMWHACGAFKKFGMSTADLIFGEDRKSLMKYPFHGNYTHMTVSSPEVVWAYEEAMCTPPGVVKPVGISRTDVFFDEDFKRAARERFYKEFPEAKNKKVILYAPTFRGRVASAKSPDVLSVPLMNHVFKDEYVLVFKHHPFVKKRPVIHERYDSFAKDMTDTMSIEDLLIVADICISDYSSLVFEYSLLGRPMIFLAHDLDNYYDWRGFYYDYREFVPGPILSNVDEVVEYIQHIDERFDPAVVEAFREKYMSSCDGHCTQKIYDLVFGAENA
jgi:CDP-glycerol glycerophosphotransferase (TagB/SpsB family)